MMKMWNVLQWTNSFEYTVYAIQPTFTSPPFMCSRADTAEVSVAVYTATTIQTRATGAFVII